MSNTKRLLIEIVAALVLLLIGYGIWSLGQRSSEQELADLKARQETALGQARQECDARAAKLVDGEATAVFRAFAAGIQGAALSQQTGMLDVAKGSLLQLPHIVFVHVLTPDGKVLASSNEKYTVDGQADDRASWALQATDLKTRPGDLPGTIEIAAPFQGASGRVAVLWLGYNTRELLAPSPAAAKPGG
jgi:hypothetical protein